MNRFLFFMEHEMNKMNRNFFWLYEIPTSNFPLVPACSEDVGLDKRTVFFRSLLRSYMIDGRSDKEGKVEGG